MFDCIAMLFLAGCVYMFYRNIWTYRWHSYYCEKLHEYISTQIRNLSISNIINMYEMDIESYNETMMRFWDWNPKNIISHRFQMILKNL